MKQVYSLCLILAAVLALAILNSCGTSTNPATAASSGTFQSVYEAISSNNCSQCHTPTGSASAEGVAIDLSSASAAYAALTSGSETGTQAAACGGAHYVVAGSPSNSYLMAVLFSDYSGNGFGKAGCSPYYSSHALHFNLSADEEASFAAWISGGALNN